MKLPQNRLRDQVGERHLDELGSPFWVLRSAF